MNGPGDFPFMEFVVSKYTFYCIADEQIIFDPGFKGATFRGALGYAFHSVACTNKEIADCHACDANQKCPFSYIFRTSPPDSSIKYENQTDIPHPFVLEPPEDIKLSYDKNEAFEFNLILIGESSAYLPYFIMAFKELAGMGLGRNRGKFTLSVVRDSFGNTIYSAADSTIRNINSAVYPAKSENISDNTITLNFITPVRIKSDGVRVTHPEFKIMAKALFRRISALSRFYCGNSADGYDYKQAIENAGTVKVENAQLAWYDWERYSTHQETRMKLGGLIGKISYSGRNIGSYLSLINIGEYVHVGKNATFGLGKFSKEPGI